jgi:Yip1 domain
MSPTEPHAPDPSSVSAMRPEMSVQETLNAIYTEPGRVFESLRERPRFVVAALLTLAMGPAFQIALILTYGYNNLLLARFSSGNLRISPEARERAIELYAGPQSAFFFGVRIVELVFGLVMTFALGALLYLFVASLMQRAATLQQMLAVWVYSSLPSAAIASLLNVALLFLRPPRNEAVAAEALKQGGLVQMYFSGLFVSAEAHPVLATALHSLDPLTLYGIFLASLGLQKVARLSAAQAWGVVLAFWLARLLFSATLTGILTAATR